MKPPGTRLLMRRLNIRLLLLSILLLLLSTTLLLLTFDSPSVNSLTTFTAQHIHHIPGLTHLLGGPTSHSPPTTSSSTSWSDTWYSSWSWLNLVSKESSNDDRVALPILDQRCPVYTYYDPKDPFDKNVTEELLLVWRRAWWAQGFKPIILGPKDAMEEGLYQQVQVQSQNQNWDPRLRYEVMRFLALGYIGGGVFADYRTIPLAPHDDIGLAFLRACSTPHLTRFSSQPSSIYLSPTTHILSLLKFILSQPPHILANSTSLESASHRELWRIEPEIPSLAIYTRETIQSLYTSLPKGNLSTLINSHLHNEFLERFNQGIDILQPYPHFTGALMNETNLLAKRLTTCPRSPLPSSCPPNKPNCKPCTAASTPLVHPLPSLAKLNPPSTAHPNEDNNNSPILPKDKFTLSLHPHPLLTQLLILQHSTSPHISPLPTALEKLDFPSLKYYTFRNAWTTALTNNLYPPTFPAQNRTIAIKRAIASPENLHCGAWATSELGWNTRELEWTLGFSLPQITTTTPDSTDLRQGSQNVDVDADAEIVKNTNAFLTKTHNSKFFSGSGAGLLKMVEEWNTADTEVWRFVKGWGERREVERRRWVEEERRFVWKGWGEEDGGRGHKWGLGGWFGLK